MKLLHLLMAAALAIAVSSTAAGADGKAEYDRRAAADLVQLFQWLDRDHDRAVTRLEAKPGLAPLRRAPTARPC